MKDGDIGGYLLGVEKMNNGDDDAISVKRKMREQMVLELDKALPWPMQNEKISWW